MKKFMQRVLSFVMPVLLVIIICILLASYFVSKNLNEFSLSPDINKVFMGDSHMQCVANDTFMFKMQNISQSSEAYLYSYYKLQHILKNNPHIDTIFLSASYHNFAKYYDNYTYINAMLKRYFFILPRREQWSILKLQDNFISCLFDISISQLKDTQKNKWIGNYAYLDNTSFSQAAMTKRINIQYHQKDISDRLSEHQITYFNKIVDFCNQKNISLIILNTPLHEEYKDNVPLKNSTAFYNLIRSKKLHLIDFEDLILSDKDFLPDGDHVSYQGSLKTSKYLTSLFQK